MFGRCLPTLFLLAAMLVAAGCGQDEVHESADAGGVLAGVLPGSAGCCSEEPDEDCAGCMATIGACCYDDAAIFDRGPRIAAVCAMFRPCKACCNECAKMTCDQIKAANACPQMPPPDP